MAAADFDKDDVPDLPDTAGESRSHHIIETLNGGCDGPWSQPFFDLWSLVPVIFCPLVPGPRNISQLVPDLLPSVPSTYPTPTPQIPISLFIMYSDSKSHFNSKYTGLEK